MDDHGAAATADGGSSCTEVVTGSGSTATGVALEVVVTLRAAEGDFGADVLAAAAAPTPAPTGV